MTFTRSLVRTLGFAALYVLATYAGRRTVLDGNSLSLVWPAAGILAVWFVAQRGSRYRWLDVLALAAVTMTVNVATGASPVLAGFFVLANLVQGVVFAELFARWLPGVWGGPLTRLHELWRLVAAAILSTTASALIGPTGVWLVTGHYSPAGTAVWLTRNTVSILLIGVAARRIGYLVQNLLRRDGTPGVWASLTRWRRCEYLAIITVSSAAYYLAFGVIDGLQVAFAMIGLTVWAGLRLHTTFVILHDLTFGTVAVLFTLHGDGPFAAIESYAVQALVAQLFVGTVAVVGLALALGRDERDGLLARLRASEQDATRQAQLMTTIVDSMAEGLAVVDESGRFLLRNPAASRLAGVTSPTDTVPGTAFYGVTHPDGRPLADDEVPYRSVFRRDGVQAMDLLIRNPGVPNGRILSMTATRMTTGPDGSRPAVVVFHDVTADRRHRDELMSFAGVVAHDLLNPLATIEGWTEALHQDLTGEAADGLGRIARAAERMRSLINDLLAFTLARDAALVKAPVDLDELMTDVTGGHVDRAQGAGQPVPRFDVGSLGVVSADPVLVRQLLENLIGNAVKYTPPGTVPEVAVRSRDAGHGLLRVDIDDHGIGIPAGQHDVVFGNFHRAHRGAGYAGTGLGLAICKRIVERHGGTIEALPRPDGDGTRMTFTLPAGPALALADGGRPGTGRRGD